MLGSKENRVWSSSQGETSLWMGVRNGLATVNGSEGQRNGFHRVAYNVKSTA